MWNYRVVRTEAEHNGEPYVVLGIHEVYYKENGNDILGHVADPVVSVSAFLEDDISEEELLVELQDTVALMAKAVDNGRILTEEELCG